MPTSPRLPVIPVLDLLGGQVVRAQRGERQAYRPIVSPLAAGSDPADMAMALLARCTPPPGGAVLYVADLDAIQDGTPNTAALRRLLALPLAFTLWLDAGFADPSGAQALRDSLGPAGQRVRPVYGSESLADTAALAALANDASAILSLDCRRELPLDRAGAWERPALWPGTLIVMTLDRVGSGSGPDLATFKRLRAMAPERQWVGAGGIRDEADLAQAAEAGADAWLVASALHDGRVGPG